MIGKKLMWVMVIGASAIFTQQTVQAYQQYEKKLQEQRKINNKAEQIRQKHMSLQPTRKQWETIYPPESSVSDLVTLYDKMNLSFLGRAINTDQIYDLGREASRKSNVGLVDACIGNQAQGMVMTFPSVKATINAVDKLESLPNVDFSGVLLKQEGGIMKLHTGKLCLLMRGGQ